MPWRARHSAEKEDKGREAARGESVQAAIAFHCVSQQWALCSVAQSTGRVDEVKQIDESAVTRPWVCRIHSAL
jgi:hypothetical protein